MDWNLAGAVILSGIVIVFTILCILIGMVTLMGKMTGGTPKPKGPSTPAPTKQAPAPTVQAGITQETVVVISAAVAATMAVESPGASYVVTDVRRAQGRPVWGFAGMQQNTRPF